MVSWSGCGRGYLSPRKSGKGDHGGNGTLCSGWITRHTRMDTPVVMRWGDHFITTPVQTALDLARCLPFDEAVASVDQTLWARRGGGALAEVSDLRELAMAMPHGPASVKMWRAVEFATPLSDSVRESQSRVLVHEPTARIRFVDRCARSPAGTAWSGARDGGCERVGSGGLRGG